jgi:xylan alpha-glucuronosyltransferase
MALYAQKFCLLNERQKALLKQDTVQANKAKFSDRYWAMSILDPRIKLFSEEVCHKRKIKAKHEASNRKQGYGLPHLILNV